MTDQTLWACHACQATNAPGLFFCAYCDTWRADRDPQHNGGVVTIYRADLVDRFRQIAIEYQAALQDAFNAGVDLLKETRRVAKKYPAGTVEAGKIAGELAQAENDHNDLQRRLRFISATLAAAGAVDRLDQLAAPAEPAGVSECVVCGTLWPAHSSPECPSGTGCSGYRWINTNRKDT